MEQLSTTLDQTQAIRQNNLDDVLNVQALIWHAWLSLSHLKDNMPSHGKDSDPVPSTTDQPGNTVAMFRRARQRAKKSKAAHDIESRPHRCPDPECAALASRGMTFEGAWSHM